MNSSSAYLILCPLITKSLINQEQCRESKLSTTWIRTSDLISVLKMPLGFFWPHKSIKKPILIRACFIRVTI